jgi:HEAT repeat protein
MVALTRLRKSAAPEWFEEKLTDPSPHIRAAAVRFYGETGDSRHATRISGLLFDDNHYVRAAAAEALGRFGDRSAIRPLMDVLTQQPPGGEPDGAPGGTNATVVLGSGQETLPEFIAREFRHHKQEAIKILGDLRAVEAVPLIVASGLRSDHFGLQSTAAWALGQIGDRRAVEPLLEILRSFYAAAATDIKDRFADDNSKVARKIRQKSEALANVRRNAVWALGRIGDPAATPVLRQALNDPNSLVREAAAEALAELEKRNR